MAGAPIDPIPYTEGIVDGVPKPIGQRWYLWLFAIIARLQKCVQSIATASLTNQSASISATTLYTPTMASVYQLTSYARVTTAAGVSSSFQLTWTWTDGGVAQTKTFTAVTGNTTTTTDNQTWPVHADSGLPIKYTVTYASNPAAAMVYRLDMAVGLLS